MARSKRRRHRNRAKNSTTNYKNPDRWLIEAFGGKESDSGERVNGRTATRLAGVYYAVRTIAGQLASLPCNCHMETPGKRGSAIASNHPAHFLVKSEPNPLMAADVFRETLMHHTLLWGNGRAAIERNNRNDPVSLIPLLPDRTFSVVVTDETTETSTKWHIVTLDTGKRIKIRDEDVLHIMGLSFDGIEGLSLVQLASTSLGLSLAAERASARHFRNNGVPGLILSAPQHAFASEEEAQQFLDDFNKYQSGVDNTSKVALLREGVTAVSLATIGRDAQWIEQRGFQRQELMLWFGLEQIPGNTASVSYNSEEQKNLAFLQRCLNPWLVRWEHELNRKLLTTQQRRTGSHFFKFNRSALMQGTALERWQVYDYARRLGVMSANDVAEKEDLPLHEGGDTYENPYTTPGTRNESATARVRQLIEARLKAIQRVEIQRAIEAAGSGRNFCEWLDSFYSGSGFLPRIVEVFVECGGSEQHAEAYANESRQRLLEVADTATPDGFAAVVQKAVSTWPQRMEWLAQTLSFASAN